MAPKSASRRIDEYNIEDEYGAKNCTDLTLKADHDNRPLWIVWESLEPVILYWISFNTCFLKAPDGHIFLESFSPVYKHAHDFLITIAEVI